MYWKENVFWYDWVIGYRRGKKYNMRNSKYVKLRLCMVLCVKMENLVF